MIQKITAPTRGVQRSHQSQKSHVSSTPVLRLKELQGRVKDFAKLVIQRVRTGMAVVGPGGLGKSYAIEEAFREEGVKKPPVFNSHITPLALYELLHAHRSLESPPIILDDLEQAYQNTTISSLLRAALWGSRDRKGGPMRRKFNWKSKTPLLAGLPSSFEFHGGVIMIANRLPEKNEYFTALLTRALPIRLEAAPSDIFQFMRAVVRRGHREKHPRTGEVRTLSRADCLKVLEHLEGREIANLRHFEHALTLRLHYPDRWKTLVDSLAVIEPPRQPPVAEVIRELEEKHPKDAKAQEKEFQERTGKSRATFYRQKGKLSPR